MSRRSIRGKLRRSWARDGFRVVTGRLERRENGWAQAIEITVTRLGTVEVELRQWMSAAEGVGLSLETCDVRAFLGATDGTRHLAPDDFEVVRLEGLADDELRKWCDFAFETAIEHVFGLLIEQERVAQLALRGLLPQLSYILGRDYRSRLGLKTGRGAWEFHEGRGIVDPVESIRKLADDA